MEMHDPAALHEYNAAVQVSFGVSPNKNSGMVAPIGGGLSTLTPYMYSNSCSCAGTNCTVLLFHGTMLATLRVGS